MSTLGWLMCIRGNGFEGGGPCAEGFIPIPIPMFVFMFMLKPWDWGGLAPMPMPRPGVCW